MGAPQDIENRLSVCEQQFRMLEERNNRVDADKAWETSRARFFSLLLLTYVVMCLLFYALKVEGVFSNALVPTMGYFLSAQTLPLIKKWWLARRR